MLDWFEAEEYKREMLPVERVVDGEVVEAPVYVWHGGEELLDVDAEWRFADFQQRHLGGYVQQVIRWMKEDGIVSVDHRG